jgi:nucleoside-diphosphate-sugar epimerase
VKILVTGGCGFVGRHLVARLAAENDAEIWIVDDLSTGRHPATWDLPATTTSHYQPYRSALVFDLPATDSQLVFVNAPWQSIASIELEHQPGYGHPPLPHFDEVYHLASVVGGRAMIDGDPLAVGIDLAIDSSLYLWAAKVGRPDRLLYASSSAAYPISHQSDDAAVALSEEMLDPRAGFLQPDMTYGWSKLTGEYLGQIAAERYGLSVAVVRPFSGYGEDQDLTYPVPAIALRAAAREDPVRVWGSGLQGRDFVHIDDCVEACVRACRTISDGSAVNIGSGVLTNFLDLAALMIDLEGYGAEVEGTDNKPVGVAQRYCDPTRMRELLDWEPEIALREGMGRVLEGARRRLAAGLTPVA